MALSLPTYADTEQTLSVDYELLAMVLQVDVLEIAASKETNYPIIDNEESLEVASIEQPGGAVLALSSKVTSSYLERPNNDGYTATVTDVKFDVKQEWYASAIPFRMRC